MTYQSDYNQPEEFRELTRSEYNQLERCKSLYMIGRLRDWNPTYPTKNGNVQIFVTPLCDDPRAVIDLSELFKQRSDDYVGFDKEQNDAALPAYYDGGSFDYNQREQDLIDFYNNQLIIFHPSYSAGPKGKGWFKNLHIVSFAKDSDSYGYFQVVPRVQMETQKFEQTLRSGEYFDLPNYDGEICDPPELVLCGQYAYRLRDPDSGNFLMPNDNNKLRWKCSAGTDIVKIDMTTMSSYKTNYVRASDNIGFMETNLYSAVMSSEDFVLFEEDKVKAALSAQSAAAVPAAEEAVEEEDDATEEVANDEENFLKGLRQLTNDNGLQYKNEDLINFHTSVKTTPLTILAGMSGTGKSRLALNYAKMLDLSEDNKDLLFLPISPSYTEPSDVLGYLNSMNGLYVPSETGLVPFLIHAQNNPDRMHMVIFDEMNLSQVEYWFSPFISILEKDKDERILTLYAENSHCINESIYPQKIKIGENIIFVGTVNIDDTTKDFSDRLLDRTFVINLEKVSFEDLYADYQAHKSDSEKIDIAKAKCKNVNQFISWCHGSDRTYLDAFKDHTDELKFFDDLNDLIKKYIPDGGISHRVLKNIGNYILNVPDIKSKEMGIERKDVLDIVLNQTVITKIRGTEMQLQGLIGTMNEDHTKLVNSELTDLLDKNNALSDFIRTKGSLRTKAEELRINGYTN